MVRGNCGDMSRMCSKKRAVELKQKITANIGLPSVGNDIWEDSYKLAMKGMLLYPSKINLAIARTIEIAKQLFPIEQQVTFKCDVASVFVNFTIEDVEASRKILKTIKAPSRYLLEIYRLP